MNFLQDLMIFQNFFQQVCYRLRGRTLKIPSQKLFLEYS